MKRILTVFFIGAICPLNTAHGAEWVEIQPKMYMDASGYTYDHKTNMARAWIKALNHDDYKIENINGKKVWYYLSYYEFDCPNKRTQILSTTYYDLNGKVLTSFENPLQRIGDWHSIVPDSIGELQYLYACPQPESKDSTRSKK